MCCARFQAHTQKVATDQLSIPTFQMFYSDNFLSLYGEAIALIYMDGMI